jgi:hypothetical protein
MPSGARRSVVEEDRIDRHPPSGRDDARAQALQRPLRACQGDAHCSGERCQAAPELLVQPALLLVEVAGASSEAMQREQPGPGGPVRDGVDLLLRPATMEASPQASAVDLVLATGDLRGIGGQPLVAESELTWIGLEMVAAAVGVESVGGRRAQREVPCAGGG